MEQIEQHDKKLNLVLDLRIALWIAMQDHHPGHASSCSFRTCSIVLLHTYPK